MTTRFPIIGAALASATLLLAGCASTAPEATAPAATAAAQATAQPPALKDEARAVINNLRNYSVHSFADDVLKKVPPALEFLAANAGDVSNKAVLAEVKSNVLKTSARAGDFDIAKSVANELLETEGIYGGWRLDAADYLAKGLLRGDDNNGADALYARFANLEPQFLPMGEIVRANALRASLRVRQGDMAGALAIIAEARKRTPGNEGWNEGFHAQLDDEAVKIYKEFTRYQEAYDYCISKGRKAKALSLLSGGYIDDAPRGLKLAQEILADASSTTGEKLEAWDWIFSRDQAAADKSFADVLGTSTRETNNVIGKLRGKLAQANIGNVYDGGHPAYYSNWPETIRAWEAYEKILRLNGAKPDFAQAQYGMIAYAESGDMKKAVATAQFGLENDKLKPEERYELALAARTLGLAGTPAAIAKAILAAENELGAELPPAERIKRFDRVGGAAVASKNENLARGFAASRSSLKPDLGKKRYVAKFSPRNIAGAGDWANLPFKPEEQDFDRKYGGGDLSFMTTDVATGDRGNAVKGGHSEHPTTLQVVTDEWGIHILLSFYDKRAREFEAGALDAGSYECYIAPGENQPYSCFLCRLKKDASAGLYHTSYNSPGHRRIPEADQSKVKSETLFTDDRVLNYIAFSWDNFATLIPTEDSMWDLECIFWGPVSSAWNGTESIHGRSTWGTLAFSLSAADRAKIYRAQIFKAANTYKAEKSPNPPLPGSVQGGVFDFWQDGELGDPEFYEKVLKPLEEQLDKGLERVKVGMSDDDVRDLTENYLQQWRDIRFTVGKLRADYLKRKLAE